MASEYEVSARIGTSVFTGTAHFWGRGADADHEILDVYVEDEEEEGVRTPVSPDRAVRSALLSAGYAAREESAS